MRTIAALLLVLGATQPSLAEDWRDRAIPIVKSEPKVVDAMFSQRKSLWVSVRDDGSRRDSFADYICLTLSDAEMPTGESVIITIWDAAAMAREEMKELGKSSCSK
jgi:hypothetical protein